MGRFCYCSKILSNKAPAVRQHWKNKESNANVDVRAAEVSFWNHLKMTGFESWLQSTPQGDFMIHCLEGESLQQIFKGLREQIATGNSIALKLHTFYLEVLGKDYKLPEIEPNIECLLDISLPSTTTKVIKKGFFYPLIPQKEQAYRKFRAESMGPKRARHEASLQAFGVSRLTTWLQNIGKEKFSVVYTERSTTAQERLEQGKNSPAWQEIAAELMSLTGLSYPELSPDVEWLTNHCKE